MKNESVAWLIEESGTNAPMWWGRCRSGNNGWTSATLATRFDTKEAAELVAENLPVACHVTEHAFADPANP